MGVRGILHRPLRREDRLSRTFPDAHRDRDRDPRRIQCLVLSQKQRKEDILKAKCLLIPLQWPGVQMEVVRPYHLKIQDRLLVFEPFLDLVML